MRRKTISAVVLLSALFLGGCASSGAMTDDVTELPSKQIPTQELPPQDMPHELAPGQPEFVGAAGGSADDSALKMVVTGHVTLTVDDPSEAALDAVQIVEKAGGRVDSRNEIAADESRPGRAELTIRIPAEELTATLEELKALGEVEEVKQAEQNVTSQARDLEARITALRASVDRLVTLMASADTTADLISIESALSDRQSNLESLESQQRSLDDQVEMSTFTLYLGSVADAPVDEPDTFLSGLQTGWQAFVGFFGFVLVALGVLLPWLVLAGVSLVVVAVLWRRRSGKKNTIEPDAAA